MPAQTFRLENETRAALRRKVEVLEEWVRNGGPPGEYAYPDGPVALQRWTDATLGLRAWASPNVASPSGRHSDLRARFDTAIDALKRLSPQSERDLAAVITRLRIENRGLLEQNLVLREALRKAAEGADRTKQLLEDAKSREAALRNQLATVRPLQGIGAP